MSESTSEASTDGAALAARLRAAHAEIAALADSLAETRAYTPTDRDGWTVKHELAYLASSSAVLLRLIEDLRRVGGEGPVPLAASGAQLRRRRGEAMHAAQELRLGPLRVHLHELAGAAAAAVEQHASLLDRPVALNGKSAPAVEQVRAHLLRAFEGLVRLRNAIG